MGGDLVGHQLRVDEYHAALRCISVQQEHQRVRLAPERDLHPDLADVVERDLRAVDLDPLRLAQELVRQFEDRVRHGR